MSVVLVVENVEKTVLLDVLAGKEKTRVRQASPFLCESMVTIFLQLHERNLRPGIAAAGPPMSVEGRPSRPFGRVWDGALLPVPDHSRWSPRSFSACSAVRAFWQPT